MAFQEYNNPQYWLHTSNVYTSDKGLLCQTLEYDKDNKWGYCNWNHQNGKDFSVFDIGFDIIMAGCERMINFAYEHQFKKYLNDNRTVKGGWDVLNVYLANDWAPRMILAGVKYYATLNSPEIFAQLSSELMEENVNEIGLTMRNFSNPDEAVAWLKNCSI